MKYIKSFNDKTKNNTKLYTAILIIIGILFAISLVGGVFYFTSEIQDTQTDEAATKDEGIFYDFPEVIANLNTSGNKPVYLKILMTLQLKHRAHIHAVEQALPILEDALETYLRELRPIDLQISGSTILLKEELTRRLNSILSPISVEAILLKEIVVN